MSVTPGPVAFASSNDRVYLIRQLKGEPIDRKTREFLALMRRDELTENPWDIVRHDVLVCELVNLATAQMEEGDPNAARDVLIEAEDELFAISRRPDATARVDVLGTAIRYNMSVLSYETGQRSIGDDCRARMTSSSERPPRPRATPNCSEAYPRLQPH